MKRRIKMAWEMIVEQCHNSVTKEAIAEAVSLASKTFVEDAYEYGYIPEPVPV